MKKWMIALLVSVMVIGFTGGSVGAESHYGECHKQQMIHAKQELVTMLNISKEDFKRDREQGLTLRTIIEQAGKNPEEIKNALKQKHEAVLQKKVDEEWMTEKKKEWILSKFDERFDHMLDQTPGTHHKKEDHE